MREHKYRIWDAENKEFIYFNLRRLVGHWSEIIFDPQEPSSQSGPYGGIAGEGGQNSLIASAPLDQYTGLKDRNGRDIYEGDILTETLNDKVIRTYEVKIFDIYLRCSIDGTWNLPVEVIGNVYENAELLK